MKISKEVKVGILAVVALTIFYLGVNFLKGINFFRPNNTYYALYDNIDGLAVSNPVLINGLTVGRVGDIKILQEMNNRIIVSIEVDDDILLGESTIAYLINSDFLGSKAINLQVGKITTPKQDNDTLIAKVDRGISEVIKERAMPVMENINVSIVEVNKLLSILTDNKENMNSIFDSFERTSRNIEQMSEENRSNISKISTNFSQLSESLNHPETGLKPLIANLKSFSDTLNNAEITQTVERASIAMQNLNTLLDGINKGNGTIGKLAKDDSLYTNLNKSVEDLDRLLIDFRENPKRYVHFSLF